MRGWGFGLIAATGLLLAPPALANAPPIERTHSSPCAKKRTDSCGCHHYYGLRHCHPKLKTQKCERPVSWVPDAEHVQTATHATTHQETPRTAEAL